LLETVFRVVSGDPKAGGASKAGTEISGANETFDGRAYSRYHFFIVNDFLVCRLNFLDFEKSVKADILQACKDHLMTAATGSGLSSIIAALRLSSRRSLKRNRKPTSFQAP
jgi:hypothetical protein